MAKKKRCRVCGGIDVRRSARRNGLERLLAVLFGLLPYRCDDCNRRFFRGRGWASDKGEEGP